jgi:Cu/Ag efflux protein CusF
MKRLLFALLLLLAPAAAFAQSEPASGETLAEVRRVDKANAKVTLRHGPITGALEMEGMTMVFQVKDPALLDRLKPGERIRAQVLKSDGVFWLVTAEAER